MTRFGAPSMTPAHRRIALIVTSRVRGLGAAAGLMCAVAMVWLAAGSGGYGLLVAACLGYPAIPLATAASRRELMGPVAGLWLQKPVREVGFILARFLETLAATVALALLLGGAGAVVAAMAGWDPERWVLRSAPAGALAACTMTAVVFGATAWLRRGGRAVVVFLIACGLYGATWDWSAPDGSANWLHMFRFVVFPAQEVLRLGGALVGYLPFRAQFVTVPLAYSAAWVAVGILGVRHSAKCGRLGH